VGQQPASSRLAAGQQSAGSRLAAGRPTAGRWPAGSPADDRRWASGRVGGGRTGGGGRQPADHLHLLQPSNIACTHLVLFGSVMATRAATE